MVKEGKIKKMELDELPINEEEKPFDLPYSWIFCRLSSLISVSSGDAINKNEIAETNKYPVYGGNGIIGYCNDFNVAKETIIIGRVGAKCGNIHITNGDSWITDNALIAKYNKYCIDIKWLCYALESLNLRVVANQTAQPVISGKTIYPKIVALPPLAEQRRIVEKLESLLPLIESYGKSQEALNALNASLPEKLRQSILQEAIQGHLVPQDPNEEPASVLLERIRAEKARLVKEGKLKKKDLEEKPISPDEIPFDIPEGWVWCRLGDCVLINPRNQADENLDAAFIPMAYIDPNLQNTFRYEVKKWGQIKAGFTHLQDNDVVFAKITPCITNRKAAIMHDLPNGIGAGTTELNIFRVYGETINCFYLLYYLASDYFLKKASYKGTAGQQRIETKYVVNKLLPLPPLAEQRRIVAKLEELLHEIDKLKG